MKFGSLCALGGFTPYPVLCALRHWPEDFGSILGAVLAGGKSSRFGSDKALAELDGHTLLARAVDALAAIVRRRGRGRPRTAPAPSAARSARAGMGPLGGIAAALHHARATNGYRHGADLRGR